jgi:hypothetical protein
MTRTLQSILDAALPRQTIPPYWRHDQAQERGRRGGRRAAALQAIRRWNVIEAERAWWNQ